MTTWNDLLIAPDNIDNTSGFFFQFPSKLLLLTSYPKIESANNTMIGQTHILICGCQAQCKGLEKPVSLSTYNRHRKYQDVESFSAEFKGFLESSSVTPMGS